MNDILSSALAKIMNAEKVGKEFVLIRFTSKFMKDVFEIMNREGYIGSFEEIPISGGYLLKVNLLGRINKCNGIKPRFSVKKDSYEKYEKRFLPASDFGILIVSTPKGLMTHVEAKEKEVGGKLICYVY